MIDDHDAVLEMLRRVMNDLGVEVVGAARGGSEAVDSILTLQPDVVILDLSMPEQSGFEIVEELRRRKATSRFLAFSGVTSLHAVDRIMETRFDGIVSKMSGVSELVEAVKTVLSGQTYVCKLFAEIRREHRSRPNHPSRLLTPREVQVLALIGEAKSNEEIASELGLSAASVQGVRAKLISKLNLQGTPQLVRYAHEHGYTEFARRGRIEKD